jgi:hypothetical protein
VRNVAGKSPVLSCSIVSAALHPYNASSIGHSVIKLSAELRHGRSLEPENKEANQQRDGEAKC